jgi:predicted RNA-binding Zn-ribbon protein involved in translation (DUF1610 family)
MKVICKQCKTEWIHPANRILFGVNVFGEDTIKWKCPKCGHIVERSMPFRLHLNDYGPIEDLGDLSRKLPKEYEG